MRSRNILGNEVSILDLKRDDNIYAGSDSSLMCLFWYKRAFLHLSEKLEVYNDSADVNEYIFIPYN